VWLGDKLYSGSERGPERHVNGSGPIKKGEDRTFVFDRNALKDRFATPLADIGGRSQYGRMESKSELILLPPSFEHVDPDHLCRLIGLCPCFFAPIETRPLRMDD